MMLALGCGMEVVAAILIYRFAYYHGRYNAMGEEIIRLQARIMELESKGTL